MANAEIQFRVPAFLAAQRAGLRSRKICPPGPRRVGSTLLRIQQIEFGDNSILHEGERTQIAQGISIHVAADDDVTSHLDGPPALVMSIRFRALIALDYRPRGTTCEISFEFDGVDPESWELPALPDGVDPSKVKALVEQLIETTLAPVTAPIDFAAFLPAGTIAISNAAVSVSANGSLLAFRAEMRPATSGAELTGFFAGVIPNHLGDADWGMFLSAGLLEESFANVLRSRAGGSDRLTVAGVESRYSPAGDRGHVDVELQGQVHLPDPAPALELTAGVGVDLSVAQPSYLTLDFFLPEAEAIVEDLRDRLGLAGGILLSPLGTFVEAALDSALDDIEFSSATGALSECQRVDPRHHRCWIRLPATSLAGLSLQISELDAQVDGVLLSGRMRVPELTPSTLRSEAAPFTLKTPEVSCGDPLGAIAFITTHLEEIVSVRAEVNLDHDGTTPVYYCGAEVITGDRREFPDSGLRIEQGNGVDGTQLPLQVVFEAPNPGPGYIESPYDIHLLIHTTVGSRAINLGIPPALTPDGVDDLVGSAFGEAGECHVLSTLPGFDLKWHVDPHPDYLVGRHRWELQLEGLPLGDSLKLFDVAGNELAHVKALPGLATMLSAIVTPDAANGGARELTLMRLREGDVGPPIPGLGIEMRQQLLKVVATLPLAATCGGVFASTLWSERGVVAVLDGQLLALELSNPRSRRLGSWRVDGLLGAANWGDGLLAFARHGFFTVDAERQLTRVGPREEASPIRDVTIGDGVAYVLTEQELQVRSPRLEIDSARSFEEGRCLLRSGERLLVCGHLGLWVYRLGGGGEIAGEGQYSWPDFHVVSLETAPLAGDGQILATFADGSARLLMIGEDDRAQEVAEFSAAPWFAGGLRRGDTLVLVGPERRSLEISATDRSHLVGTQATNIPL